jgi:hypothetical protein
MLATRLASQVSATRGEAISSINTAGTANMWIVKPTNNNRGNGIRVFNTFNAIDEHLKKKSLGTQVVVQKYIERPLLYKGRKFDIRQLVLVDNKMNIYVYKVCAWRSACDARVVCAGSPCCVRGEGGREVLPGIICPRVVTGDPATGDDRATGDASAQRGLASPVAGSRHRVSGHVTKVPGDVTGVLGEGARHFGDVAKPSVAGRLGMCVCVCVCVVCDYVSGVYVLVDDLRACLVEPIKVCVCVCVREREREREREGLVEPIAYRRTHSSKTKCMCCWMS